MSDPRNYPPEFEEEVERRRSEALLRIQRIPVADLIWGPPLIPERRGSLFKNAFSDFDNWDAWDKDY
jgi:hypothetical protein